MLKFEELIAGLEQAGVKPGMILCTQGSYKGTGGVEGGIEMLVKAMKTVLGPDGTLIMPAYNLRSWTESHYFDRLETASGVGAITEVFRKSEGVRRSRHPIHSLSVWGKYQTELCEMDYMNSYGPDSIFAWLLQKNALYSTIGLGLEMPFLPCHFAETEMKTPYRRTKNFAGIYLDENNEASLKTYNFDVRREQFRYQEAPIFQTHIWQFERNAFQKYQFNNCNFFIGTAQDYHQSLCKLIEENPKMFGWS